MEDLSGKVAFVTGGASGIGFGMARRFAAEGMKLFLADIEPAALAKAKAELASAGTAVAGRVCDVSDRASVDAARDAALEAFGAVDVLCNNAGVSPVGDIANSTEDDWRWGVGVNLMGVVHGVQSIVPGMRERGQGGHVVNTASVAGLVALPLLGIYAATKFGVVAISEVLRGELEPAGIGVSVLCPSFVKTNLADSTRNRPSEYGETPEFPEFVASAMDSGMEPDEVGDQVVAGIRANRLYIITHPDSKLGLQMRMDAILAACDPS